MGKFLLIGRKFPTIHVCMETELARHLTTLADRYAEATNLKQSTVGRLCAGDGRFFKRIEEGQTFTAKKYDVVVSWFSLNWPDDAVWPDGVMRPAPETAA